MDAVFATDKQLDKRALKALAKRSDTKGLTHLVGHLLLAVCTGTLITLSLGTWLLLPALVAHGFVLVFFFAPLHETVHWTAFRTRWINDLVASLCGLLLLLPARYFRAFHFAHHRFTQDPERDPELGSPKTDTWLRYLLYVCGWNYWRDRFTTLPRHALGKVTETFVPAAQRGMVVWEARAHLAFYTVIIVGSWMAGSWAAALYWALPVVLGQPFLRLYLIAEHTGCPQIPDMFENTRTTISLAPIRWLAWNMPYHVEHHAFPAVPFHALPAAHQIIRDRIAVLSPGYLAVNRDILKSVGSS